MVHALSDLAPAKYGPFFNGSPTLFARKTMLLLVRDLFQHVLKFVTSAALKCANLIIVRVWIMIYGGRLHVYGIVLCKYFKTSFYIYF
jgi:hypothetical protein